MATLRGRGRLCGFESAVAGTLALLSRALAALAPQVLQAVLEVPEAPLLCPSQRNDHEAFYDELRQPRGALVGSTIISTHAGGASRMRLSGMPRVQSSIRRVGARRLG